MFLDHTQRHTTVGRTPLDEWSIRRRDLYLTTHNTHNRQTSMPPGGFELTIAAGERPKIYALDRAVTGTGLSTYITYIYHLATQFITMHGNKNYRNVVTTQFYTVKKFQKASQWTWTCVLLRVGCTLEKYSLVWSLKCHDIPFSANQKEISRRKVFWRTRLLTYPITWGGAGPEVIWPYLNTVI